MKSLSRRLLFGIPLPALFFPREARPQTDPVSRFRPALWHRTELYFGTVKPDGSAVTDEQFALFIDQQVTPRFPDGLTLLTGYGQYRTASGVINKEKSHLLILFFPPSMNDAGKRIEELRDAYKSMYQQEAVLRADSGMPVSF